MGNQGESDDMQQRVAGWSQTRAYGAHAPLGKRSGRPAVKWERHVTLTLL